MSQTVSRRGFLEWCAALSGVSLSLSGESTRDSRPPNIVFILVDDLGWRDVGCYGSTYYETPNVDRLARRGMRFTDGYAACTVCSPTRASLLTGKYPARLHLTDWISGHNRPRAKLRIPDWTKQLEPAETTLAEALRSRGYSTGFIGKWHLGPTEAYWPLRQGFDTNIGGTHRGQPPRYFAPYGIPTMAEGPTGEYLTDRHAADAEAFLVAHRNGPFLLYLSMYAVHTPLQAKQDLVEKYRRKAAASPAAVQGSPVYAAMLESMDACVGRVIDRLDALGLASNTIVFFTGDNGGLVGPAERPVTDNSPLRAGKGSAYEGGVREPFLVVWPDVVAPASICSEPVTSVDVLPTVMEMVNGSPMSSPDETVDGLSLVPVLRGGGTLDREAIYWHYPHYHPGGATPYGAIRAGDWKLIEFFEDDHVELYNLAEDIGESRDLAAALPERARTLRATLHAWRDSVGAQMPSPNPDYEHDAESSPRTKPRSSRVQDPFAIVREAQIERRANGWDLSTAVSGTALKRLALPITGKAVFDVTLQTRIKRNEGWQNGFLALGDSDEDADLLMVGLYIGRQSLSVFRGHTDRGDGVERVTGYDRDVTQRMTVTVDIPGRTVVLACGGTELRSPLPESIRAIRFVGYHAIRTTTHFSEIVIRR